MILKNAIALIFNIKKQFSYFRFKNRTNLIDSVIVSPRSTFSYDFSTSTTFPRYDNNNRKPGCFRQSVFDFWHLHTASHFECGCVCEFDIVQKNLSIQARAANFRPVIFTIRTNIIHHLRTLRHSSEPLCAFSYHSRTHISEILRVPVVVVVVVVSTSPYHILYTHTHTHTRPP